MLEVLSVLELCDLCVCAKSLQLCLTLWDPMDCSPPGSSVHGILQERILELVAMPFSRGSSQPRDQEDIRDAGSISGSGSSPREGNGNSLQYSCLENPMERGTWQATVYKVTKNRM